MNVTCEVLNLNEHNSLQQLFFFSFSMHNVFAINHSLSLAGLPNYKKSPAFDTLWSVSLLSWTDVLSYFIIFKLF